jgi:hypothetical protein
MFCTERCARSFVAIALHSTTTGFTGDSIRYIPLWKGCLKRGGLHCKICLKFSVMNGQQLLVFLLSSARAPARLPAFLRTLSRI